MLSGKIKRRCFVHSLRCRQPITTGIPVVIGCLRRRLFVHGNEKVKEQNTIQRIPSVLGEK